jgi:dihydroorotate dehydrogenase (NAD+) catalytic subunit
MELNLAPAHPDGLRLRSPILIAAGALGYGVEYARTVAFDAIGGLVTRTTSLRPHRSPALPRLIETPAGLLYVGGDTNPGLRAVAQRYAPQWEGWGMPVLVSVGGAGAEQCADAAAQLGEVVGVAGAEFSLARFMESPAEAVRLVRAATSLPLLVKLPLDAPDLSALAQQAADAGADALVVAGPPRGLWIDPASGVRVEGWLCGPALLPLALRAVAAVAAAVAVPVVGGGGVSTAQAARQMLAAGATAVSIGAALLANPRLASDIAAELAADPPPEIDDENERSVV